MSSRLREGTGKGSQSHYREEQKMAGKKTVGIAFTAKGRERAALKDTVREHDTDPDELTYTEDKRSGTAKVTDKKGRILNRYGI